MNTQIKSSLAQLISKNEQALLSEWVKALRTDLGHQQGVISENELNAQCGEFLGLFVAALQGESDDIRASSWQPIRSMLTDLSRSRAERGFSPSETATFIFSLKKPLFSLIEKEPDAAGQLMEKVWNMSQVLDKLGLLTTEIFQEAREDVIKRQQLDMLELSTPVVSLAEGILALPLIGTLDSARTQVVMESLLQSIVQNSSNVAIIDITGVPTVDTLVAQHLLKTVTAARLMGADCIISGIRPQIAQTIVHLGVELGNVITKATLASAFKVALDLQGMKIVRLNATAPAKA